MSNTHIEMMIVHVLEPEDQLPFYCVMGFGIHGGRLEDYSRTRIVEDPRGFPAGTVEHECIDWKWSRENQ